MINKIYSCKILSVSAGVKTHKEDGVKQRFGIYKVKFESDDIPYEDMAEYNSQTSATLLNIQPMPFESVNFGDQSMLNMNILFSDTEDVQTTQDLQESEFKKIMIKNLTVKNKGNIPTYIFTLEIPITSDGKFLFSRIKSIVNFKFMQD